jgi:hypothetical protein
MLSDMNIKNVHLFYNVFLNILQTVGMDRWLFVVWWGGMGVLSI